MEIVKYGVEIADSKLNVLVKESAFDYGSEFLNKPSVIVDMLNAVFHVERQAEEHVWMLAMNNSCEVLGVFEVCHGSVSECTYAGNFCKTVPVWCNRIYSCTQSSGKQSGCK